MAMTTVSVTSSLGAKVVAAYAPQGVSSTLDSFTVQQLANAEISTLTYGTSSGLVDLVTCSDRTISAASTATYDLYTGTDLLGLAGETCAFRKVKYIEIMIVSGGDSSGVQIGGAAANEWVGFFTAAGDKYKIFPSGPPFLGGSPAGVAVGVATKNLLVENLGAASVTVRILVAGSSV